MIRQSQKRTQISTSQCTGAQTLKQLAPFGLTANSVIVPSGSSQIVELESTTMEVRGAVISSSQSNRVSFSNGDVSAFLAAGSLTFKEKLLFSHWPNVRDNYLIKDDRFYTMDKVRKEYTLLSEQGLDLVKVANSVPSYFQIDNLDVFNHSSMTSKYPNNSSNGKCSSVISTLKISLKTGSTLTDCPNSTCSQHYGVRIDMDFMDTVAYSTNALHPATLGFPLYFVCSQNTSSTNLNPRNTWCYIALDTPPQNLNGNTTWRLANPIEVDTSVTL